MIIKEVPGEDNEEEIKLAKEKPYDGKTIYSEDGNKKFLGYQLVPYRKRKSHRKTPKGLELVFEVGTTVVAQYYVSAPPIEEITPKTSEPPLPREENRQHHDKTFLNYIDGVYCDDKIYNEMLQERAEVRQLIKEKYGRREL